MCYALPCPAVAGNRRVHGEAAPVWWRSGARHRVRHSDCGEVERDSRPRRDEIDLDPAIWTVPAERIKAGCEHHAPLSTSAMALLKAMPRVEDLVFPGMKKDVGLSGMTLSAMLKRMGRGDITVHGLGRRSVTGALSRLRTYSHARCANTRWRIGFQIMSRLLILAGV